MGIVYLVGAGPGDVGLLTLKAAHALSRADVLVYDRLAEERILDFAPEDCEKIYVGKASSNHAMKQEDINKLLAKKAKEGKTVVRLKGGDPFVFGRGGEEALLLKEENVPFVIVPGVTSAIAAAAYAGIPVTHRGIATSFAVVTGHEDPNKEESSIRWKELATATDTIVFLMGVENLPKITKKLIENGRDKNTPAALVRWGTRPEQEVLMTTVENAAEDVKRTGLKPPAVFVVGDVVKLRETLAWFDTKSRPLFGKRILVTRARAQASSLTELLEEQGARVIEAPTIKIAPPTDDYAAIDAAINNINAYSWVIFTSVNGVREFFFRLYNAKKDSRAFANAKIAAIGTATAAELVIHSLSADIIPKEFRAEGIIDALKDKISANDHILIARAEKARDVLPETLKTFGANVEVAPVYKTVTVSNENLKDKFINNEFDIVTFTSSSTVTNLIKIIEDPKLLENAKTACIGPVTAETLKKAGIEPNIVATEYTIQGLVKAILEDIK